jgi:hypothetical protein
MEVLGFRIEKFRSFLVERNVAEGFVIVGQKLIFELIHC